MILFFHFLCLIARYIVINISKSIRQRKEFCDDTNEKEAILNLSRNYLGNAEDIKEPVYQNGTLKFFPPIYVQRYETVAVILHNFAEEGIVRKVVDFGCSELGLFPYLKNMESVFEILEVDIDEELLQRSEHKAAPLTSDYLMSRRSKPLDVYLLAGSVADYDDHLIGCDTVICIELIEHLAEDVFYKMPYNIFHLIKPRLAIFTTPNADFNSLFPNFNGLRHEDHKFEWSRKEFYLWTQGIISQYPEYSVRFYGVGAGPEGTENLGCCSQVAVFKRSDDLEPFSSAREEPEGIIKYKVISHYKYPLFVDTRTTEEKVLHEIQYQVAYYSTLPNYYNYEENETEIPLSLLKRYVEDYHVDERELLSIITESGMEVRKKGDSWYLIVTESAVNSSGTSFEEEDWLNKDMAQSFSDQNGGNFEEDWDLESHPEDKSELTSFITVRSLEESRAMYVKEENEPVEKDKTQSAPSSSNKQWASVPRAHQKPVKSKIPRKSFAREEKNASSVKETFCVCEPFRKISKSYSLDSCMESGQSEGGSPLRNVRSFSSGKPKRIESGSSLLSSSIDRAGDSGYPFSYTDNLTPELLTEDETSRSTSLSSEADVILPRVREFGVVENGDLANNNRDLEGNNVEGLMEMGEFPPWLLNLGDLAPVVIPADFAQGDDDEGVGNDTSSESNQSIPPDEFDFYFET